jgi:predicted lipoprotein with Yx(FWY)xxD motif
MGASVGAMRGLCVTVAASIMLLAGCGAGEPPPTSGGETSTSPTGVAPTSASTPPTMTSTPPTTDPPTTEAPPGTVIMTAPSEFGEVLFDGSGQAIYLFDLEDTATPACYDDCAVEWPPILTDGTPVAGAGVDASLLGTVMRTDSSTQVTYNGHPLYAYAHEGKNEVKCHNVSGFGGLWFALSTSGDAAPS